MELFKDKKATMDAAKDGFLLMLSRQPFIGLPIELLRETLTEKRFRNIERFNELAAEKIKSIESAQIVMDDKFEKLAETSALFERVWAYVEREVQPEKVELFAKAIAHLSTTDINLSYPEKVNFVDALDILNHEDIDFLSCFAAGGSRRLAEFIDTPHAQSVQEQGEMVGEIIPSVAKLESRGLLTPSQETQGGFSSANNPDSWINQARRRCYQISPLGIRLLKIVDRYKR